MRGRLAGLAALVPVAALLAFGPAEGAGAQPVQLCGNQGPAPGVQHVVVVMMENLSYNQVVGSPDAPFQTSLASQCGVAADYFGATHTSAANYLAMSAGEYPASSPPGCGSVSACADSSDNLYHQLSGAGLSWGAYQEAMPSPCDHSSGGGWVHGHYEYKIGHNPVLFYSDIPAAQCAAFDVGVADLTAQSGAFWTDLQNQTLPSFSFVTPDASHDAEAGPSSAQNAQAADAFLQKFTGLIQSSPSYLAGNTLVLVVYDEGAGADYATGENCASQSLDLPAVNGVSARQDSCHVALFVIYPFTPAGDTDTTFFNHYSVTRTVEALFGLPALAGAAGAASLVGHFGIPGGAGTVPPPTVTISQPAANSTVAGTVTVSGTAAGDGSGLAGVQLRVDGGPPQPVAGTANWSASLDSSLLANGPHTVSVTASDTDGGSGSASVPVTVSNPVATGCPALPAGATELSGNVSVEASQSGWTGVYSAASAVTRVQPPGGGYDGTWALQVAQKAGSSGPAGVNNAFPVWVPGAPGTAAVAGQVYTGSAVVDASGPDELISLIVRETTPAGAGVGYHTTTVSAGSSGWQQISSAYTAKNSGDLIRYSLYAANLAGSGQYFLADCLSLRTAPQAG